MRRTRHNTGWIRMMGLLGLILAGFACADSHFDDDGEGGFRLTPEAESTMPLPSLDALPPGVPIVYAGIFSIGEVPEEYLAPLVYIEAPRQLFPFARAIIADAVRDGGFPPLLIQPIDFVALFQQRAAQAEAEQG